MPKPTTWLETWKHGFIRVDRKGRKTYLIREMRDGVRVKISTRAHTLEGAMAAYELWSKAPAAFDAAAALVVPPSSVVLLLTQKLVDDFVAWSEKKGFRGYGNSASHVANQKIAMDFWMKHLARRDLKAVSLEVDVLKPLLGVKQQANRRRTLKAFYSWLRSEDGGNRLRLADDPLARALKVPKSNPTRRAIANKAVPLEDLIKVRDGIVKDDGEKVPGLDEHWRATFVVQMATGWHNTELRRFAVDGAIESYVGPQKGVAGVLKVVHKSGAEHRTAVDVETLNAAREVRAYGSFEPANYSREVRRVSKAVKVSVGVFTAGRLRHSVATNMINDGADLATVSTFLGHRSPQTTKAFYATHVVPLNPGLKVAAEPAPEEKKAAGKKPKAKKAVRRAG